jgi:hypothetical protein
LATTLNVGDHFVVIVATCSHCCKGWCWRWWLLDPHMWKNSSYGRRG